MDWRLLQWPLLVAGHLGLLNNDSFQASHIEFIRPIRRRAKAFQNMSLGSEPNEETTVRAWLKYELSQVCKGYMKRVTSKNEEIRGKGLQKS